MSTTTTNPTNFDVLKDQLFITYSEATERRSSGNLLAATLRSLWMWFKLFLIVLVMFLYAFVFLSDLAKLLRPVAHADKSTIGSAISVDRTRERFDSTLEFSSVLYDTVGDYVSSKTAADDTPDATLSARDALIASVDAAFALLEPVERTRLKLEIGNLLAADDKLDFYVLAASKLGL